MWVHSTLFDMSWALVIVTEFHSGCDPVGSACSDLSSLLCALWTALKRWTMVGQDLDQSSHELRLVPEGFVVRQLECVLNPIRAQCLAVITGSGEFPSLTGS